jgi:multiple sugar transport system ATP-binding protein
MGRALVREPNLFLLDEPLSNIDAGQRAELRSEISGLAQELGVTVLYVTHDQTEALTMANKVAIMRRGQLLDFGTPTDVYNRPASVYVAAFLGNPRMSLMQATVQVWQDREISLLIGKQTLRVPATDPRSKLLSRYHGDEIVVGARPEALYPIADGGAENVLTGHLRHLEHHGHETLAFLDIAATAGIVEDLPPVSAGSPSNTSMWRTLTGFMSSLRESEPDLLESGDTEPAEGRHHRTTADLTVRLAPYPQVRAQSRLSVSVDIEALHFFNDRGRRIDVGFA